MSPTRSPDCGCCAGLDAATPRRLHNPPGRTAIDYRLGRHGDFLASLLARLSSTEHPALAALTSREADDATLALCDALASSLEVLTFYTERIANEHYLRTATERLSVMELARLIGYAPAPGVAASTHLAFTLQAIPGAPVEPIEIPAGTRVQSVPGQDERAQTFETVAAVPARADWNAIPVQTSLPWQPRFGDTELWLAGVDTRLEAGDAILIVGADRMVNSPGSERWDVRVLAGVEPDTAKGRTRVVWDHPLGSTYPPMQPAEADVRVYAFRQRTALFGHNAPDPNLMSIRGSNIGERIDTSVSPWEWRDFAITPGQIDLDTDNPRISAGSWIALVSNEPGRGSPALPGYVELYRADRVERRSRTAFGISGKITRITPDTVENLTAGRYPLRRTLVLAQSERLATTATPLRHPVQGEALTLGRRVEGLRPGQPLALYGRRQRIALGPRAEGLVLVLDDGSEAPLDPGDVLWLLAPAERLVGSQPEALPAEAFTALLGEAGATLQLNLLDRDGRRGTLVAQSSDLRLAPDDTDDPTVSEVVFLTDVPAAIVHARDHSHLKLAAPLQHVYARDSLRINANVAPATHGESVEAILGSGDAGTANQRFRLDQAPLTYVTAKTPSGRASTLRVRVDEVLWTEVPSLYGAAPDVHRFETLQDASGHTRVQFGDGQEGARLPSGESNVRVRYRKGLGVAGNLATGKLTTLLTRPLGVSEVTNPAPALGGEDPEPLDRARDNAPLTVRTLDRAVSIADYADFARAFAGIDKAHALWLPAGPARGVFLTIAGIDGAPVPEASDTFRDLSDALGDYGDPLIPLRLANYRDVRFRCRLALKVDEAFETEAMRDAVADALRTRFGFAARRFGQGVSVDEVAAVAQGVRGVVAVQVSRLHRLDQAPALVPRLFAALPVASLTAPPQAAELLTLADEPLELEALP